MANKFAVEVPQSGFTRPADTDVYASGDLIANSTTAGDVEPLKFQIFYRHRVDCYLRRIRLIKSGTSVTNSSFRVHFFRNSPVSFNGDNGVFNSNSASSYLGAVDVTVDQVFTDGSVGIGVPKEGAEINFVSNDDSFYALIEAIGAYTPVSEEEFTIISEVHRY